jgi:hypothetical protein
VRRRWAAPDPRTGVAIELGCGDTSHIGNVSAIGQRLPGEGFASKDPPPALDEVEPGSADGDKGVLNTRVGSEPVPDRTTQMAGEVIGDKVEVALGIGPVEGLQQGEVVGRVARWRSLGKDLPIAHAEGAIHPDLFKSAVIVQGRLDAMPIHRPAKSRWEIPRGYGAEFVDADDRRPCGRRRIERDDGGPFGTKSGSLLVAQSRVRRQRTPSRRKMRRA